MKVARSQRRRCRTKRIRSHLLEPGQALVQLGLNHAWTADREAEPRSLVNRTHLQHLAALSASQRP